MHKLLEYYEFSAYVCVCSIIWCSDIFSNLYFCEVSGCDSGVYEDDCLMGCHPDDEGSKYLWNIGHFLWDHTAQHPRR
jgi:hypothetical protein